MGNGWDPSASRSLTSWHTGYTTPRTPSSSALGLDAQPAEQYCYHRESPGLSETLRIREMNANKLAANLLLPEDLVRRADIEEVLGDFRGTAARWEVSRTTLRIRLQDLGLIDEDDAAQIGLI